MKIFYYTWKENCENDMAHSLQRLGHDVIKCYLPFFVIQGDDANAGKMEELKGIIAESVCDLIISFNYFYQLGLIAEELKIPYFSWIYDAPHYPVYSKTALSEYVYLFPFDRDQYNSLLEKKKDHVYHSPLAVNHYRLNGLLGELEEPPVLPEVHYDHDISFVGSLYESNLYRKINFLPEYLKGYLEASLNVQQELYGCNLFPELLTQNILNDLMKYVKMERSGDYQITDQRLYADMLSAELTCRERLSVLNKLGERYKVDLYTGSAKLPDSNVIQHGIVTYEQEMPQIFRTSKINLNITLRSITSGIPLRALDIMGAGGFLLSNYQPELAEHFQDGVELAMYGSMEELLEKTAYYLEHEEERRQIAYRGWQKTCREFSYETRLGEILSIAEKSLQ